MIEKRSRQRIRDAVIADVYICFYEKKCYRCKEKRIWFFRRQGRIMADVQESAIRKENYSQGIFRLAFKRNGCKYRTGCGIVK